MKVVYVIDSLASKGGAERIISEKMNYMAERFGYDVTVITCYQSFANHPNTYHLSPEVRQVNLDIPYYSQYSVKYPKRLFVKWSLYKRLRKELTQAIETIDPDILVSVSYFNADMLSGIRCRAAKVVEAHESRLFTLQLDGESKSTVKRLFTRLYEWWYFRRVEHRANTVVCLTKGDAKLWHKARRVEVIPNFSIMPVNQLSSCDSKRVIAVGRLEWQKGYDMLLEAWAEVEKRHPDWELNIYGSGRAEQQLRNQLADLGLCSVKLIPFTPNISEEYSKSSILVLSSRFEGLSLVLIEALRHALPEVAFNCPFGPNEVIEDGKNGYLVTVGDIKALTDKLCVLIENPLIRKQFSAAAIERAKLFDVDTIMSRWKKLFEEL
jgi:glycosyltransferase involved in cell wall biosynthesis